ncbi:ABC transporter substrate-binding protein [Nocardioides sp. L-11A]|uniref:ABC transporter substrate-binding protein n=1 Tax=Nocardioides sp. L-11A TaxID=3043848 RepID=UPI00249BD807|nr:ABC transporter substrate-binding protein [Nocardioides sp. L-11A]
MKRAVQRITVLAIAALAATACTKASSDDDSATPSADVVATVDSAALVRPGHLTTCMDMPYKPFQYFDESGDPVGVDIDLIKEVAARIGLKVNIQNSVFDTIIAALKGGKCDMIWADQYVTPERIEQIDMVAYWKASEVVVVPEGNPKGMGGKDELCGFKVAGQKGGADVAALEQLDAACKAAGRPGIEILQFPRSPDAYQALASGHADAWMTEQVAALLLKDESKAKIEFTDTFALGDGDLAGLTGLSFRLDDSAVKEPVMKALAAMVEDGTYAEIWEKWGLTDAALDPDDSL